MGKPQDTRSYNRYEANGIDIYVKSDVKTKDDSIAIKYSKMLWMEKLVVEGIVF